MPTVLLRAVMRHVLHEEGSRADEAHVSLENIQEFREFIQAGAAHQLAKSRESIRVGQKLPLGSAGSGHRAELIQNKGLTVQPGTSVREQERRTMDGPRRQCDDPDDRKNEREKANGHQQVEDTLPREESGNGRLGGVGHVAHNGVNFRAAWRATKS